MAQVGSPRRSARDPPDQHLADTLTAGRGLRNADAVGVLVTEASSASAASNGSGSSSIVRRTERYEFGREGGDGRNRILHAGGSATGAAIAERLIACVRAEPRTASRNTPRHWQRPRRQRLRRRPGVNRDELLDVRVPMTLRATAGPAPMRARRIHPRDGGRDRDRP